MKKLKEIMLICALLRDLAIERFVINMEIERETFWGGAFKKW